MQPEKKRFYVWLVVVGLLIIIAIATFIIWRKPAPGTPVYAPQGQIVAGFPKELLIDSLAKNIKSYSINYSSTTNQYTVMWTSSDSAESIATGYSFYFQSHGWSIENQENSSPDLQSIYATNASGAVNMTATTQGAGVAVTVTFVPVPPSATPNLVTYTGTLNLSFPPQFIVASDAVILGSTYNPDPSSSSQTVGALYSTKESITALLNGYTNLLSKNGWQVISQGNAIAAPGILAINQSSGERAEIRINGESGDATVSVSLTTSIAASE